MANVYGYARCSTDESRQNIDRQKRDLLAMGVDDESKIYWEYESGSNTKRPEFKKLLDVLQAGDTLMATEVSRLTRSTQQLCEVMQLVQDRHICLQIGAFTVDCRNEHPDAMTKGMLMMWGVFAEMERDMISERVKSGMAAAKAKGKQIGRAKMTVDEIPERFWKPYASYQAGHLNKTQLANALKVTRRTLYKWLDLVEADTKKS